MPVDRAGSAPSTAWARSWTARTARTARMARKTRGPRIQKGTRDDDRDGNRHDGRHACPEPAPAPRQRSAGRTGPHRGPWHLRAGADLPPRAKDGLRRVGRSREEVQVVSGVAELPRV